MQEHSAIGERILLKVEDYAEIARIVRHHHERIDGMGYPDAIADTGADLSVLPQNDCLAIDLFNSPYFTGVSSGVVGSSVVTLIYHAKAEIDGNRYAALIQPVVSGKERIVGRDVLNQLRILFDGPGARVIVDP